jgi:hypothetical protein
MIRISDGRSRVYHLTAQEMIASREAARLTKVFCKDFQSYLSLQTLIEIKSLGATTDVFKERTENIRKVISKFVQMHVRQNQLNSLNLQTISFKSELSWRLVPELLQLLSSSPQPESELLQVTPICKSGSHTKDYDDKKY